MFITTWLRRKVPKHLFYLRRVHILLHFNWFCWFPKRTQQRMSCFRLHHVVLDQGEHMLCVRGPHIVYMMNNIHIIYIYINMCICYAQYIHNICIYFYDIVRVGRDPGIERVPMAPSVLVCGCWSHICIFTLPRPCLHFQLAMPMTKCMKCRAGAITAWSEIDNTWNRA